MKKIFICLLLLNLVIPNEIYKQIRISNVDNDDVSLFQYSGIDIDHAHYSRGYYIEFAIFCF